MPIKDHPNSDLLESFAAGALALPPALVVEAHIEACEACRSRVSRVEAAHGRALTDLPDAPMRRDALERAMAALSIEPGQAPNRLGDVALPEALRRRGLHARRFIGPDYWVAPVRRARDEVWRAYVLRAPAGTLIPSHRHLGREFFQVLMGEVADESAHATGDFVIGPTDEDHALAVASTGPCACLIAVEHGARWRGVARVLAPWLGI